jgi:ABC-2 type transport system ATP-binding protein
MTLIQAVALNRFFGATHAVKDVSFNVEEGEIYGLVGSDGAGKTTTLRLIIGALRASSGYALVCGKDPVKEPDAVRSNVGYLSQRFSLYEDLSVLENIRFFAEVRGMAQAEWKPRCMELLEFVGLSAFAARRAGALSGGMKQKLGLASALVTHPKVLLLDEPTTGVDPVTRQDFWQLILRVVQSEKMAVMLTTPYMDEASRCQRLGFMRSGSLIAEGTPSALRNTLANRILEIPTTEPLKLQPVLSKIRGVEDARPFGDRLHLRIASGQAQKVMAAIAKTDPSLAPHLIPPTLEDVFLALTSEQKAVQP